MNKLFFPFSFIAALMIVFTGCSSDKNVKNFSSVVIDETAVTTTTSEAITEPPITERHFEAAEGNYIYDNAKILDKDVFSYCNDYCEWLYENYLINAAVVTTSELGGVTPEDYAANAYADIYDGKGSGLLLLINNDTNKDYIYKTGSCLNRIDSESEKEAFYFATREIVSGDYKSAIIRLMQLGEKCSDKIYDNAGVLNDEDVKSLENICNEANVDISVLVTRNSTEVPNEEICRTYAERRYKGEEGVFIMLDAVTGTINIAADSIYTEKLSEVIKSSETLAQNGNYIEALSNIINEMKG